MTKSPTPETIRPALAGRKRRTAPQVMVELSSETKKLAESLVPQSVHDTEAAIRRRASGYGLNTLYRPHTIAAIIRNVMRGMTRGAAADLVGVKPAQLYNWVADYPDLADALSRAEAFVESDLIEVVRGGFARNPRLALELLERRFPRNWAQQSRHEHTGMVTHGIMSGDFLQKLAAARAQRDALSVQEAPKLGSGRIAFND